FTFLKKTTKFIASILLTVSFSLFLIKSNYYELFLSFNENVNILSFFIFLLLLGILLNAALDLHYLEIVYNFYIYSIRKLYSITNLMSYRFSVLMNLGAITLVH